MENQPNNDCGGSCGGGCGSTRRNVLKAAGATLGAAAFAKALSPIVNWSRENLSVDQFLQQHYRELDKEQLAVVLKHLEEDARKNYGAEVTITDHRPQQGVKFGYALNLSICIGCRRCAEACHHENNHDRPSGNSYIRVLEMQKGSMDLEHGDAHYEHPVPHPDKFYMPVQCQQCDNPPCVHVCPVEATWKEKDGIVVVDTTGASAAVTAKPPARITRGVSTGPSRRFPRRKSIRTNPTSATASGHRA